MSARGSEPGECVSDVPSIYGYLDFRAYLRDWFQARKAANPRFSHRLLARRAGITGPSTLLNVMEGRRNISGTSAAEVARAMGLDDDARAFFLALVRIACSDDAAVREAALEQVQATRRFREARVLDAASLRFLSLWYLPAIFELSRCAGFRADPDWIAAALRPTITPQQAADALGALRELGLLRMAEGRWVPTDVSVVTPHEVSGLAVRAYHRAMMQRAQEALDFDERERHLCGVTVAVPAGQLPALKAELDRFQERILHICDGVAGDRALVMQLNLQLIPLSVTLDEVQ